MSVAIEVLRLNCIKNARFREKRALAGIVQNAAMRHRLCLHKLDWTGFLLFDYSVLRYSRVMVTVRLNERVSGETFS